MKQMQNNIFDKIVKKIEKGWYFQPILFLWENSELLNQEVNNIISELFKYFEVDKNSFYKIEDNKEKIKITQTREFISKSNIKSSFKFQIFLIEDISRFTLESANSSLKFFEEPGNWNIIFLTATQESWVLDTILSRVQIENIFFSSKKDNNDFYYLLIDDYLNKKNINLIKYFYQSKDFEKQEYIDFLNTFISYIKQNFVYVNLLDQIEESLNLIQKNNVLAKYEIDKLILKL